MRKFDSNDNSRQNAYRSAVSPDRCLINYSKNVTPFEHRSKSPSPNYKRVQQSPLQISLALAISKLLGGQVRSEQNVFDKKISFTELLNESNQRTQISVVQLQNIKNILQQFMQSLYNGMQRDISQKFNVEMKRMILKYRQADTILRKIQQIVVANADIIQLQQKLRIELELCEKKESTFMSQIQYLNGQIQNYRKDNSKKQNQIVALKNQLRRATTHLQKYQNAIFRKLEQNHINRTQNNNLNQQNYQNGVGNEHQYYSYVSSQQYKVSKMYLHQYEKSKENYNFLNIQNSNNLTSSRISNINQLNPSLSPIRVSKNIAKNLRNQKGGGVSKKPYENSYLLIKRDMIS